MQTWERLIEAVIRPPRRDYTIEQLGPTRFTMGSRIFTRTDVRLPNDRGLQLVGSHWEPERPRGSKRKYACVIYCHGNCGCRLDALDIVQLLLPTDICVFSFDFAGCGQSEGEDRNLCTGKTRSACRSRGFDSAGDYISLGVNEKADIGTVVEYLRTERNTNTIALWGHSMGAVAALLCERFEFFSFFLFFTDWFRAALRFCNRPIRGGHDCR